MSPSWLLPLLQNAALLLAVCFVYDVLALPARAPGRLGWRLLLGTVLGAMAMGVMLSPWVYVPGIAYDTRSVLLAASGLFFGGATTAVAVAMAAALRVVQGGAGMAAGVSVIAVSGAIGVAWRHLRRGPLVEVRGRELLGLGLAVHAAMLACMLLLPDDRRWEVVSAIALPVLTVYPAATVLVGSLLARRLRRESLDEALRESEELFRAVFEEASAGYSLAGPDGTLVRVNAAFAKMLGLQTTEVVGRPLSGFVHPDDLPRLIEAQRALLCGERETATFERRYVGAGGRQVWAIVSSMVLRDASRAPRLFVTSAQDITERKRAEEEVQAARDQLRRLLSEAEVSRRSLLSVVEDHRAAEAALRRSEQGLAAVQARAGLGSFEIDPVTGSASWSPEMVRLLGADPGGAAPSLTHLAGLLHPDDRHAFEEAVERAGAARPGVPEGLEARTDPEVGPVRHLSLALEAEARPEGGPPLVAGTALDVTGLKRAEEEVRRLNADLERRVAERTAELEAANRELEAFTYSVSHDLRAPVRSINGFARILEQEHAGALDAEGRRLLSVVIREADRMGTLIDDLLRFSRLGRQQLRRGDTDVTTLTRQVWAELAERASGRAVDFRLAPLPRAVADPALLRQVLANLLENALKYTSRKERATIEVEGEAAGAEARYRVRDDGAGFDPAHAPQLFRVFQRLHSSREFEGTGVGLALVKRIVERHGGRVWAEGEVGRGACFGFSLPLSPSEPRPPRDPAA